MAEKGLLCRTATTFSKTGEIDEDAQRAFLQRFVDAKMGVYLGSGGSGEGHALTREELRKVYKIGVATCKGKVMTNANPPEQHTARATIEHAQLAIECGVELVNVYQPTGWHNFRPMGSELMDYYDVVLGAIKHPVALAQNLVIGYQPKPEMIAALVKKFPQVMAVNMPGANDENYFLTLKEMLNRDVACYVPLSGSPNTLTLGAAGLIGGDFNILTMTVRHYLNAYNKSDLAGMGTQYAYIKKFIQYVKPWDTSTPRWMKMVMRVLKIPGGEGGLREPYRMPPDAELHVFLEGLLRLGIPEIADMAKAAGIRVPA